MLGRRKGLSCTTPSCILWRRRFRHVCYPLLSIYWWYGASLMSNSDCKLCNSISSQPVSCSSVMKAFVVVVYEETLGPGAWKKEVMFLSRDLDSSIGNINHHLSGAVAKVVDWIQHTWENSVPMDFKSVKEVVARGVALRCSGLWKKIRNNEDKLEKLSD